MENLENKIKALETQINICSSAMIGEVEEFQMFLRQAMTMQLHAFTANDYPYTKPNLKEFEEIMFNIDMLHEMLDLTIEKQILESYLEQEQSK
ncbi:MAG: hypothetical protein H7Z76_08790 [Methylotenera sp.]|nr:hypothetical protein [Flavobacterium sp.]